MAKTKRLTNKDDDFNGGRSPDTVLGLRGDDRINGGAGNDKLNGNAGNDTLIGGAGNDRLYGGAGKDMLDASKGNDFVDGGSGRDTVIVGGSFADAMIRQKGDTYIITIGDTVTRIRNVEFIQFTDGKRSIQNLNHAPTADATANASGNEDTVVTGAVTATDKDGDALSYTIPSSGDGAPAHGAVTIDANGNYTYTPAANFNGSDTFTVTISDSKGGTTTQVVNVSLAAVNDAPTADASQAVTGQEDTPVTGKVIAQDVDGDTLAFTVPSSGDGAPAHGTVTIDANGNYTYTPAANFNGADSFTVTISDGHGGSTTQVVNVTLDAVNDPVTGAATATLANGSEDTSYVVSSADLLAGFSDADGNNTLSVANLVASNGATVTDNGDGTFTITPAANFNGAVTLNYDVTDGQSTAAGTQTVNFAAVNDAPVASGVADVQIVNGSGSLFPTFAVSDVENNIGSGTVLSVQSDNTKDALGFNNANGVTTAANVVLVNGVGVGTFVATQGGLTITFNANATPALINAVGQAVTVSVWNDHGANESGTSTLSVTVTDTNGATSAPITADVIAVANSNPVDIDDVNNDSQVTGVGDAALAVDRNQNATVDYVQSVGVGNVDAVKLTISLGGESDPSDVLALPTALAGNGTIANIAGNLIYQSGGVQYNVGTVTRSGTVITVQLNDNVAPANTLTAADFDNVLGLVIRSTTVDAGVNDGVRDVTFQVGGVGTVETEAVTAHIVVTANGEISLTADSDPVAAGIQGDTNASLGGIDATGINVFNAAAGTLQSSDNFSGGSTGNDILTAVLDSALGSVAPTIASVETFNLSSNGAGAGLDATNITNTNAMTLNISGANAVSVTNIGSTFTTVDASESIGSVTLTTQNGQNLDITTGTGPTSVSASDSVSVQAAVTIDTSAAVAALTLSGSADFSIEGSTNVNVDASGTTDSLSIESVDSSLALTTGTGPVTVANIDAAAILTIDADSMADDALLSVSGAGDVNINGGDFLGNLNASGLSGDLRVDLGDDENGAETASVTLGSGANQTVLGAGADDTITVNAAAAVQYDNDANAATPMVNADIVIGGDGTYVINNVSADVDASTSTGSVTINAVAGSSIDVAANSALTAIMGAATMVSIDASAQDNVADVISIGSQADDFAGDIDVTGLGSVGGATLNAQYLTGALSVATDADANIVLGAAVSSFDLEANGSTSVDASGYTGAVTLSGAGDVTLTNVGSITIDGDDSTVANNDFTGALDVTLKANANATIIAGTGDVTVTSGDADGADAGTALDGTRSTVTVNATEMDSGSTLTIDDSLGGFNLNVSVTGLANGTTVDLSGSAEVASTATVSLTTAALGAGDDVDVILGTSQSVTISSSSATASAGTVHVNAAAAIPGDFAHDLAVTPDSNAQITLTGNSAYDLINVSANVTASAATGDVSVNASVATLALSLVTGSGNDDVTGGAGADTISTGSGDDVLNGGAGRDLLTGGTGADTFVFVDNQTGNTIATADHITDFVINEDVINLSNYHLTNGFADLTIAVGSNATVITIGNGHDDRIVLDGDYTGQTFTQDQFVFV